MQTEKVTKKACSFQPKNQERGRLPRLASYSNCSTTTKRGKGPVATTYTHIHTSKGKVKSPNFDPLQVVTKEPNPPAEVVLEKAEETTRAFIHVPLPSPPQGQGRGNPTSAPTRYTCIIQKKYPTLFGNILLLLNTIVWLYK